VNHHAQADQVSALASLDQFAAVALLARPRWCGGAMARTARWRNRPSRPRRPAGPTGPDATAVVKIPATRFRRRGPAPGLQALAPQVTVTGVTINSAPVVKLHGEDAAGNPVVGLGQQVAERHGDRGRPDHVAFTLAKLVRHGRTRRTGAGPSKWSATRHAPPTVARRTAAPALLWYGTYPPPTPRHAGGQR